MTSIKTNGISKEPKVITTVNVIPSIPAKKENGTTPPPDITPEKENINDLPVEVKKEEIELPKIEDRFYKMDVLFSLRSKYDKLKESLDKLNKFKLSTDGRNDNIVLTDDKNNIFKTNNPEVFAKMVEWLKEDLSKKIKDTDEQIKL